MKTAGIVLAIGLICTPGALHAKKGKSYPTWKIGGQVVLDKAWFLYDKKSQTDQEIRRARLFLKGALFKKLSYEMEYSFTGGGVWKDLYLRYHFTDLSSITVGNIKEPFGLEALTSSKYNTFMERALPDIFISDRKVGVLGTYGVYGKKSYLWRIAGGLFTAPVEELRSDNKAYTVAAKTTFAKILGKKHLLHTGVSAAYTHLDDTRVKFSTRAGAHLSKTKYLNTKVKHTDDIQRYGVEAYYQYKAFSAQGEYIYTGVTSVKHDYGFFGWYFQTGYFLTHDAKRYKIKDGATGRLEPKHPLNRGGTGAVEIAARISELDMSDKPDEGKLTTYTAGVNWYMTSRLRMMLNIVKIEGREPKTVEMRIQYDF